jgi:hypothetical protein
VAISLAPPPPALSVSSGTSGTSGMWPTVIDIVQQQPMAQQRQ